MDIKALLNYRSLRALLKDATLADLEKIAANLEELKSELEAKAEAERAEREENEAKIKLIMEKMGELGVSASDFMAYTQGGVTAEKKAKRTMKPKYRYTALDGTVMEWTGQGKLPKPFALMLSATGKDKEEFRIRE